MFEQRLPQPLARAAMAGMHRMQSKKTVKSVG
jgi:hypothetical protein